MRRHLAWVAGPALVGLGGISGAFALGSYQTFVLGVWAIYALATIGLMFPAGWVGEISVGHAGILAIAAYTAPLLGTGDGLVELITACAFGVAAGSALGMPSLRLRGFGLAIVTLVFGESVRIGLGVIPGLGGTTGRIVTVPRLLGMPLNVPVITALTTVLLALALVSADRIRASTLGRAWRAVRDNEPLARAFGCRPEWLRLLAFALSGLYCGAAGVLLSWLTRYIAPSTFNLWLSIYLLAIVVIGGRDEIYGPLVGAGLVVVAAEMLRLAGEVQAIVFGIMLLLVAWLLPEGVVRSGAEAVRRTWRARARQMARPPARAAVLTDGFGPREESETASKGRP